MYLKTKNLTFVLIFDRLEHFRCFCRDKHTCILNEGTIELHLAFKLEGVGQGGIVLSSALIFSPTCNTITDEKVIPVFTDYENDT